MEVSIERPAVYVVATPIGNLGDLSGRAAAVLDGVDFVLSEDTRRSRVLLDAYGIATSLRPFHDHNEKAMSERVVAELVDRGEACALVSDAGTPLVADPGFALVRAAAGRVPVIAVPGPCALVAALSVAGLPTDRFAFEGFLPPRDKARRERLEALAGEARTLVFYESPHRIAATVDAMVSAFDPERSCALARELTKAFESVFRGTLAELRDRLAADANAGRGELVVLVGPRAQAIDDAAVERVLGIALEETDLKTAVRLTMRLTGAPRNRVYARALEIESEGAPEREDDAPRR